MKMKTFDKIFTCLIWTCVMIIVSCYVIMFVIGWWM